MMKKIVLSIISLFAMFSVKAQTVDNHFDTLQENKTIDINKIHLTNNEFHNDFHVEPIKKKNFIGIGVGQSILSLEDNNQEEEQFQNFKERRKKFWNIYTGHQLNDNFSVKAEYLRLIDIKSNKNSLPDFKMRALSFSGLGFYPINRQASVFGEAGLYLYRSKETYENNERNNQQNHGTKPFVGVGLKYDLGKSDLIIKYNNFGKVKNNFYNGRLAQIQFNVEYKF